MELRFEAAAVRYDDGYCALQDVSFTVPAGQFCVILGHSGAGKSTMLRAVNGLTTLTSGKVSVGGVRVQRSTLPSLCRQIGMVHQSFSLAARSSVATNVMAGAVSAMPFWRAATGFYSQVFRDKACALIAAVGLDEIHLTRRTDRLSIGQQQRVGIARAFMLDPSIILADEPVASLDPRLSGQVLDLLRVQARMRGTTVLCSLHQLDLAREYADRIIALQHGRVVFDGPPAMFGKDDARRIYAKHDPAEPVRGPGVLA